MLPAPRGATADKALAGTHGRVRTGTFLGEYPLKDDRELLAGVFRDRGLRHIAARGWTTPDGTRTRVYLLPFDTGLVAGEVRQQEFAGYGHAPRTLRGAPRTELDGRFPDTWQLPDVMHYAYDGPRPYGAEQVRQTVALRRSCPAEPHLGKRAGARPRKLGSGSVVCPPSLKEHPWRSSSKPCWSWSASACSPSPT
nr:MULTISPECIES: hypothetical protein [Streptomyces]